MTEQIYQLPRFQSELGDILFPGEDIDSQLLNNLVGELISYCETHGLAQDSDGLSKALGDFVPAILLIPQRRYDWSYLRDIERWNAIQKPTITAAIEKYFVDSGDQARLSEIERFIDDLESAGVTIEGKETLRSNLKGDWRKAMTLCLQFGRSKGIRFIGRVEPNQLTTLLHQYRFKNNQIEIFLLEL